jgi:hypothetical protein
MKPQRLKLAHNLLVSYGVYRKLEVYVSIPAVFVTIRWIYSSCVVKRAGIVGLVSRIDATRVG